MGKTRIVAQVNYQGPKGASRQLIWNEHLGGARGRVDI